MVAGEAHITESSAYENKSLLALLAIACALIGIVLPAIAIYHRKLREAVVEPQILADGWKYDQSVSDVHGRTGQAGVRSDRLVRPARRRRRRQRCRHGIVGGTADVVRKGQTGNVRNYAGIVGIGVVLLLAWFVLARGIL